jgi:uncharacterized membrane protein YciS (DUF1049 family)
MMNDNFDNLAKKALSEEEFEFMNNAEEQNIFEMLMNLYKGKQKWLSVYIMLIIFIAFGFTIWCGVRFFQVEDMKEMMIYGAGGFLGLIMTAMLKFWFWMQMDNQKILRELKRIELQMSIIAMNLRKEA